MMNKRLNAIQWLPSLCLSWLACDLQLNLSPSRWDLGAGVSPTRQHWILELGPLRFLYERNERPFFESDLQLRRKDPEWLPLLLTAYERNDSRKATRLRFHFYNLPSIEGEVSAIRLSKNLWDGLVVVRPHPAMSKSMEISFEQVSNIEVVDEQA